MASFSLGNAISRRTAVAGAVRANVRPVSNDIISKNRTDTVNLIDTRIIETFCDFVKKNSHGDKL